MGHFRELVSLGLPDSPLPGDIHYQLPHFLQSCSATQLDFGSLKVPLYDSRHIDGIFSPRDINRSGSVLICDRDAVSGIDFECCRNQ